MEAVATPDNLEAFVGLLIKAAGAGQWALFSAAGLVGVVWVVRKLLSPKAPFLATPEGGALLNLFSSFASGLVLAFTGTPFSWALVWSVALSVFASGGRSLFNSLVLPLLLRIPFIAQLFGRGDAPAIIDAAKRQGLAAAVVAKAPKSDDVANGP